MGVSTRHHSPDYLSNHYTPTPSRDVNRGTRRRHTGTVPRKPYRPPVKSRTRRTRPPGAPLDPCMGTTTCSRPRRYWGGRSVDSPTQDVRGLDRRRPMTRVAIGGLCPDTLVARHSPSCGIPTSDCKRGEPDVVSFPSAVNDDTLGSPRTRIAKLRSTRTGPSDYPTP